MAYNGNTLRKITSVLFLILESRHGLTVADVAQRMYGPDCGKLGDKRVRWVVAQLHREGLITREPESVPRLGKSRNGDDRPSHSWVYRYRIHPDLLRRLHEAWGATFEAMSAEIANDRRRVG